LCYATCGVACSIDASDYCASPRGSSPGAVNGRQGAPALAVQNERAVREDAFCLLPGIGRSLGERCFQPRQSLFNAAVDGFKFSLPR